MRVSTRILSGTGILVVLALLALSPLIFIGRIQSLNNSLVNGFSASKIAESIVEDVDVIANASRRYFSAAQIDYTEHVEAAHTRFEDDVKLLKESLGSQPSAVELQDLETAWEEYKGQWNIVVKLWEAAEATGQPIETVQLNDIDALAMDTI